MTDLLVATLFIVVGVHDVFDHQQSKGWFLVAGGIFLAISYLCGLVK